MPEEPRPSSVPEYLRVPWGPWRALLVFTLVWIGIPLAIILVTRVLAPYSSATHWFLDGLINNNIQALIIEVGIQTVISFAFIYYLVRQSGAKLSSLGWRGFNIWRALGLFVIIFLVFTIGVNLLLYLVTVLIPGFNVNQAQTNDFTGNVAIQHPVISILALVIIPPIIEETTFRGFIFPALSKRFGTIFGAISSSLLFGLAHLQGNVTVYTFFLGLLLCYLYTKTRSIFPGMGIHMLNNYLAFIALAGK